MSDYVTEELFDIKTVKQIHIDPVNWDEAEQRPTKEGLKDIHIAKS
jgi:hypothetical protein